MTAKKDLFDVNGPGLPGQLFGLPYHEEDASLVVVPIPWEVTVSYHGGTAEGALEVLKASRQVDLFVREIPNAWTLGIALSRFPDDILKESRKWRKQALAHIESIELPHSGTAPLLAGKINEACESLNVYVKNTTRKLLAAKKMVGILGGDHSTPLGYIQALGEHFDRFGILQIDAHSDLRKAYQGFTYSHASIMHNVLKLPAVSRLIQIGIRDICEEEQMVIHRSHGRVKVFYDDDLKGAQLNGEKWSALCQEIVAELPDLIYISFDIDGLDPQLCPHTGTPVPGGFDLNQIKMLFQSIVANNKKIIGFDLCEVACGSGSDWDANVGSRVLYLLCNYMGVSQNKLNLLPPE
jgi:agmatinase